MPRATSTAPTAAEQNASVGLAPLTTADIEEQTDPQSFSRGRGYARGGRIFNPVRRENVLQARCHGSSGGPYQVMATLAPANQPKAENPVMIGCNCPRGGFCKHIVALLLTWIEQPKSFEVRPPIGELLATRSHEELVSLIELLVKEDLQLEDRLLTLAALPLPNAGAPSRELIDEAAIRRQIASALPEPDDYGWNGGYSSRYRDWDDYYPAGIPVDLERLVALGEAYVNAGDWRNALRVFATFVEEIEAEFEQLLGYDEEGELLTLIAACDRGLAAILDAQRDLPEPDQLSADERQRLIDAIYLIWETDLEAGGYEIGDDGPEAIGRNATPDEKRAIGDHLRQFIRPTGADDVTRQHQSRAAIWFLSLLGGDSGLSDEDLLTEYRNAELWEDAAHTLLRLHRVEEAIALAARRLTAAPLLTRFADQLIATGDPIRIDQAISLVDGCLWEREGQHPPEDHAMSAWLERQYAAHGRPERALALARRRFDQSPSKQTYEAVATAARLPDQPGDPWSEIRPALLTTLQNRGDWFGLIDIHLAADEVAAALAALKQTERGRAATLPYGWGYVDGSPEARVAAAAEQEFPDEAIRLYRRLADRQIEGRQRTYYHEAATYLKRVKQVLTANGRTEEWLTRISELRQQHKTLRALQDELNKAGLE